MTGMGLAQEVEAKGEGWTLLLSFGLLVLLCAVLLPLWEDLAFADALYFRYLLPPSLSWLELVQPRAAS